MGHFSPVREMTCKVIAAGSDSRVPLRDGAGFLRGRYASPVTSACSSRDRP